MRARLKQYWLPLLAAALALGCLVCVWRVYALKNLLPAQHAAERWQGEGGMEFAQISFFMARDQKLSRDQLYSFRTEMYKKLEAASLDPKSDSGLVHDAWSTSVTLKVANGRQSGEVQVIPVGGSFFDFHPLRLLSGNYLTPGDVMDDRVLLDRETAWLLFGGTELSGMSFTIEGAPFVVAGVYEHADDRFSRRADEDVMCIYMSYDAFERMAPEKAGVTCYELLMADPVRGFARTAAAEKFPVKSAEMLVNSGRFEPECLYALLKDRSARSMRTGAAIYPAWENAARAVEDRAAQFFAAAIVLGVLPAVLLIIYAVRLLRRGRKHLGDELLPDAGERLQEFHRVRARKRWEKKHPAMK